MVDRWFLRLMNVLFLLILIGGWLLGTVLLFWANSLSHAELLYDFLRGLGIAFWVAVLITAVRELYTRNRLYADVRGGAVEATIRRLTPEAVWEKIKTETTPMEIERQATDHFSKQQGSSEVDAITHLPWSTAARKDAAQLALAQDLHVICIYLTGLGKLMDVYGYQSTHSVLRQVSRRLKRLMDRRDLLTRHSGDKLLIFTTRGLHEIETLATVIHEEVFAIALEAEGERLPKSRIGVTTLDRVKDPAAAETVVDAVVISAEVAAATVAQPEPEPAPKPSPAPEKGVFDEAPAASHVAPLDARKEPVPKLADPAAPAEIPSSPNVSAHAVTGAPETPEPSAVLAMSAPQAAKEPERPTVPIAPPGTFPSLASLEKPTAVTEAPRGPLSVETAVTTGEESHPGSPDGAPRILLKAVSLDISGLVATTSVRLVHGERQVTGKAVGRSAQERQLFLVAEATARGVTEFLPIGYGVVVHDIRPAPPEVGKALWAVILFLTPTGELSLLGIASSDGTPSEAAAKAVLSAVNRRIGAVMAQK